MTRLEFLKLGIYALLAPFSKYMKFLSFSSIETKGSFPARFPIQFEERKNNLYELYLPTLFK